jgi:hypothetical protein
MVLISTHFHFKVSASILAQVTRYSGRFSITPPSILGTSFERHCMLPNLSLNTDVPCAGLRPHSRPPISLFR